MIQDIIDGIVAALRDAFPGVKVYDEPVKQGLTEPCFILQLAAGASEQFLGGRHYRTYLISVQYIPESVTDPKAECNGVADALFQTLEYITAGGDFLRGTGMNSEYSDGVLTFFVNFNMFVRTITGTDTMEEMAIENYAR